MYRFIELLATASVATIFGIILSNFLPPQSGWLMLTMMWAIATLFARLFVTQVVHADLD